MTIEQVRFFISGFDKKGRVKNDTSKSSLKGILEFTEANYPDLVEEIFQGDDCLCSALARKRHKKRFIEQLGEKIMEESGE